MILYNMKVFEGGITGAATADAVYTPSELNARLGQADKFFFSARVAQGSGSSPTLTVLMEHSNDNVNWKTKSTPINAQSISGASSGVVTLTGEDTGSSVCGAFVRFLIGLGGTTPSANVQVWVTGRTSD